jgi:hypothetical protein
MEQVSELFGSVLDIDSGEGRFKISQWIDSAADKFVYVSRMLTRTLVAHVLTLDRSIRKSSLYGRLHFELGDWMAQYDDLRERVNQNGGK